ncbi:MAG TPA: lipoprotein LpqH [Mycobacterium sp.]|nr:lipoprotein LpqH [Mycobacterium sp.]
MAKCVCAVAAAVLILSGCAPGRAAAPGSGALPPGTAKLVADGKQIGTTYSVGCQSIDWMTRIQVDLHDAGVSAMLSSADKLTSEFVRLHDVDGFSGSYERARQGEASVTMTGPTYQITGVAMGFNNTQPTRLKAETFTLTVSC